MFSAALVSCALAAAVTAQQIGKFTPEVHPPVAWSKCTRRGCTDQSGAIVLDANYRWLHTEDATTCNPGGFNKTICPDAATCSQNCALEGADYANSYGVTTADDAITLKFGNGGARIYLMHNTTHYELFKTLNKEFTFDVDMSKLGCGMNGALYFSEMVGDGGLSATNAAGATYGTGYCDAQCSGGTNFFNGTSNPDGKLGACCNEMDIWEANSLAAAYTPHPCNVTGTFACTTDCKARCDPAGCDFNSFRLGNQKYLGPGLKVDTSKKFTVVTQFYTKFDSDRGDLVEIRRLYVQDGKIIPNSYTQVKGMRPMDSITPAFCDAKSKAFNETSTFNTYGGLKAQGQSLGRGVVLVMSLWHDGGTAMKWLDAAWPEDVDKSTPGVWRGPCAADVGYDADPASTVVFSNIKFGDIGTTYKGKYF